MIFVRQLDNTVFLFALNPKDMTCLFKNKNKVDVSLRNIVQVIK